MTIKLPIYLRDSVSPTTSIADMQRCKYLAFVNSVAHLSGKTNRNIHLEAGGGFAKAIELTRVAFFKDGLDDYDAVNLGLDYLETEYAVIYAAERWKDENKSPTKLLRAFEAYFRTYHLGSEYTPYTLTDGTVTVEQQLLYDSGIVNPFTGNTIKIKCKLDMLGHLNGNPVVIDEKTAKSVRSSYEAEVNILRSSLQFGLELAIVNKVFAGQVPTVCKLNARKIVLNKSATAQNDIIKDYEFIIGVEQQKACLNTAISVIQDYVDIATKYLATGELPARNYGQACQPFMNDCALLEHCTAGLELQPKMFDDLFDAGYIQQVYDSTKKEYMPINEILKGV